MQSPPAVNDLKFDQLSLGTQAQAPQPIRRRAPPPPPPEPEAAPVFRQVQALYNFTGASEAELSMTKGDFIEVWDESTGDGWFKGRKGNSVGDVPVAYVKDVTR